MAKLIQKPSPLKDELVHLKNKSRKNALMLLACIALAVTASLVMQLGTLYILGLVLIGIAFIAFIISLIQIISIQNDIVIKGQGVLGEDSTAEKLAALLDDSYTVFQNVIVTLEGKSSEIDIVVLGPNGIFVIETKNRNGVIEGGYDKDRWIQHKVGRGGTPYSSDFYSPVKQVSTHVFRLAGFLRNNGVRFHICGAVFFSNHETKVRLSGEADKIPVYSGIDDLILYIKTNNLNLPLETKESIINLLK